MNKFFKTLGYFFKFKWQEICDFLLFLLSFFVAEWKFMLAIIMGIGYAILAIIFPGSIFIIISGLLLWGLITLAAVVPVLFSIYNWLRSNWIKAKKAVEIENALGGKIYPVNKEVYPIINKKYTIINKEVYPNKEKYCKAFRSYNTKK